MRTVDVTVYYLEMLAHPSLASRPRQRPEQDLQVVHAKQPTVAYYRFLYNAVGSAYHWHSRGRLSDAQLAAILHDPRDEIHVLLKEGNPAGFAELDRRNPDDVELVQFGLMPEYIGQGLGQTFLLWTIDKVWIAQPKRFWLHTCTLDHPAALPNYLKAGFTLYREEKITREIASEPQA